MDSTPHYATPRDSQILSQMVPKLPYRPKIQSQIWRRNHKVGKICPRRSSRLDFRPTAIHHLLVHSDEEDRSHLGTYCQTRRIRGRHQYLGPGPQTHKRQLQLGSSSAHSGHYLSLEHPIRYQRFSHEDHRGHILQGPSGMDRHWHEFTLPRRTYTLG